MQSRQMLALLGALVLFVGVFAPIVSVPIVGQMNYFQNGKGDGAIVLALAVTSAILAARRKYAGLWLTGGACAALLGFTFYSFESRLNAMRESMGAEMKGNMFRGLAEVAVNAVQLQWGWAVLVVGVVMLLVAAGMKEAESLSVSCPHCGGVLPISQPSCNHCRNAILWIRGKAMKPSRLA